MINKLPVIGWLLSIIANISLSVPFYICWSACGIGERYFYFLPPVFQYISFWHCVGLFLVFSVLRPMLPTVVSISQTNDNSSK